MNLPSHDTSLTRRAMLRSAGLGLFGASLLKPARASAATPLRSFAPGNPADSRDRFPRLVQEYYVQRVREVEAAANARRAALATKADAAAYVRDVRSRIQACFGPWPEKTPLNTRVTGRLDRGAYRIEKLIFDSRPDFPVTANLYVPQGRSGRLPGVVAPCGHYPDGKAAESYQSFAQGLARLGYMVLIYDPIGQAERLQYLDAAGTPRFGRDGMDEHLRAGNQQVLVGDALCRWWAWDGIRALDCLCERPEVDPARIGVTGNSGGGTAATWLCGTEPRWCMAAPECFVTTFRRNLENELPADSEQCPPRALALGLDHSDFIAAMAPKPVALIGQEKDFFDARGLEEAYERLRRLYGLLGAEENIRLVVAPDYHSYSQPAREAMYAWFNGVTGVTADAREPALTLEKPEDLLCAPGGQMAARGARTVASFTRARALALRSGRPRRTGPALAEAVRGALKLPPSEGIPEYRILRPDRKQPYGDLQSGMYLIETEPPAGAVVYRLNSDLVYSRPPRDARRALLYVCHRSSAEELTKDPWLIGLVHGDQPAFTCDPRGIGESTPNTCGRPFDDLYGSDYCYAAHGNMLDQPYVGRKTFDVLRVIDWLMSFGHEGVHLAAAGWGTLPATFAALLSPAVRQVTLKGAPSSYEALATAATQEWPLSTFLPGVLERFDLPDCYAALAAKGLRLV